MNIIEALLANLPTILSVLAGLGLWKLGAAIIRAAVAKAKELAGKTSTKLDDIVVSVVGAQLEEIAKLLDAGKVDEAKRQVGIVKANAKPVLVLKK